MCSINFGLLELLQFDRKNNSLYAMRIGILTLPLHTNYGGILQAYALQTILERMGHDVKVIDYDYLFQTPSFWTMFKRFVKKILHMQTLSVRFEEELNKPMNIWRHYTQPFINMHIHRLPIKDLNTDLFCDMFDCIVVGSDQIWRPTHIKGVLGTSIPNAFLDFAKEWPIKRIAYSASFGTDEWEFSEEETSIIKKLISKFDAVSVREDSGVELCKRYLGIDAFHTLDPTLLLEKNDYLKLCNKKKYKKRGDLLVYILDDTNEKDKIINILEGKYALTAFKTNIDENKHKRDKDSQPPVEDWLMGFMNTKYVITDSFHACIFSIIFEKPFIVIDNQERGMARISSLLTMFNMKDRLISNIDDVQSVSFKKIDTHRRIEELQKNSLTFLSNALN